MNNSFPQTKAEIIGKYGCLAMCYIYCMGVMDNDPAYFQLISNAMDKGILANDCTVTNASKFLEYITGKRWLVEKMTIENIADIREPTPVRFDYNGNCHWVVVQDGKIVFNSIQMSVCVNKGIPTTARIIKLA